MVGEMGEATTAVAPEGTVRIQGALWRARTNRATPIELGDAIRVVAIDGLTLEIEPEEGGAKDYREMRGRRGATTAAGPGDPSDAG
jgi:membrane-bound serine protease (ClpP class)